MLNATRLRDNTQIELLQLPLEGGEEPSRDRQQSQGRFLALQQEFLDPATMVDTGDPCRRSLGAKTDRLDDVEYRYPTLIVKYLHIWPLDPTANGNRDPPSGSSAVWKPAADRVAVEDSDSGSDRFSAQRVGQAETLDHGSDPSIIRRCINLKNGS